MELRSALEVLAAAQRDYVDALRLRGALHADTPEYHLAVRQLGEAWYRWRVARQEVKRLREA